MTIIGLYSHDFSFLKPVSSGHVIVTFVIVKVQPTSMANKKTSMACLFALINYLQYHGFWGGNNYPLSHYATPNLQTHSLLRITVTYPVCSIFNLIELKFLSTAPFINATGAHHAAHFSGLVAVKLLLLSLVCPLTIIKFILFVLFGKCVFHCFVVVA